MTTTSFYLVPNHLTYDNRGGVRFGPYPTLQEAEKEGGMRIHLFSTLQIWRKESLNEWDKWTMIRDILYGESTVYSQ